MPIPYIPPIEPKVPAVDHSLAKMIADQGGQGLAAFTNMYAAAQRNKLEQEAMVQRGALAGQELDLRRQTQAQQYQLEQEKMKADADYRSKMLDFQSQELDYKKQVMETSYNDTLDNLNEVKSATSEAQGLGLTNFAENMRKNPIQTYLNLEKYNQHWGMTAIPEIKQPLGMWNQQAKEIKIPFIREQGQLPTMYPVEDLLGLLRNKDTKDATIARLKEGGQITDATTSTRIPWIGYHIGKDTPAKINPDVAAILNAADQPAEPSLAGSMMKPRGPRAKLQSKLDKANPPADQGTLPTAETTLPPPSQTPAEIHAQKVKEYYDQAVAAGEDPAVAKEKLTKIYIQKGYDPSNLHW